MERLKAAGQAASGAAAAAIDQLAVDAGIVAFSAERNSIAAATSELDTFNADAMKLGTACGLQ